MSHADSSSLISLGLATDISPESPSFRWGLATSCLLHALIIILAVFLRFQSTTEEPFRTIDVALISLPESTSEPKQEKSSLPPSKPQSAPPKPQPAPPKAQPVPPNTDPTPLPREEILPLLPTQTASERLSDFLGGAIRSIVVPDRPEVAPQVMPPQLPEPIVPKQESPLIENLKIPSSAPQLSRPERLHPAQPFTIPKEDSTPHRQIAGAQSAPPQPKDPDPPSPIQQLPKMERTVKQAPAIPELSPVTPFHKSEQEKSNELSSSANIEEALKRNLPTVPTPLPAPTIPRKATTPTQIKPKKSSVPEMSAPLLAKVQESRQTETLSHPVEPPLQPEKPTPQRVKPVPQRTDIPRQSLNKPVQPVEPITPHVEQEPPREKMSNMMKQLLGEVQIPNLKPQPTIPPSHQKDSTSPPSAKPVQAEMDQRIAKLSIPDVRPVESIKNRLQLLEVQSPSNSGNSASQSSPGKNRYLAMVEEKIDQQWVAPPLVATTPVVVLKFRISRSGEISQVRIDESSGNGHYDSAAQRAVHAVNPLPPFPRDLSDSYFDVRYRFIKKTND